MSLLFTKTWYTPWCRTFQSANRRNRCVPLRSRLHCPVCFSTDLGRRSCPVNIFRYDERRHSRLHPRHFHVRHNTRAEPKRSNVYFWFPFFFDHRSEGSRDLYCIVYWDGISEFRRLSYISVKTHITVFCSGSGYCFEQQILFPPGRSVRGTTHPLRSNHVFHRHGGRFLRDHGP